MSRNPIDTEMKGLQTPRERVWAALMSLPDGMQFDKFQVQDLCNPMVRMTVVNDYALALCMAGYLKKVKEQGRHTAAIYVVVKRSYEAPRLNKQGQPVTQGTATLAMWRAMKISKTFDYKDIAAAATLDDLVVTPATAQSYINALARAGYLQTVRPSKPGTPALYRLVRNTGPKAPAITRRKVVYDRNTGQSADLETAQEVCDAIEA